MVSALVNDGQLEEGLNQRNSTVLGMVKTSSSSSAGECYGYFGTYFSAGYAGYYAEGIPSNYFSTVYPGEIGFVDLTTGILKVMTGSSPPTTQEILDLADQANQ